MANRRGREVPTDAPFAAKAAGIQPGAAALIEPGAIDVKRPTGRGAEELSSALEKLGERLGRFADEAAGIEGARAGLSAGLDPNFRPRGRTGIYGRNFERTATDTYLDRLEADVQTRMRGVYEQHKSDPAALAQGLNALRDEFLNGTEDKPAEVFPEIGGRFLSRFAKTRLIYEVKARDAHEDNARDQRRAALYENTSATLTTASQAAAANPADPQLQAVVQEKIAEVEKLYDVAAANDDITHEQSAKLKANARGTILSSALLSQAEKLESADAVAAFRKARREEFAAGKIKGMDAQWYAGLDSSLATLERQKGTAARTASNELSTRISDWLGRVSAGQTPPAGEWNALLQSSRDVPDGARQIALAEAKAAVALRLRGLSIDDGDAMLRNLRQTLKEGGGVNTDEGLVLDYAEQQWRAFKDGLKSDQLGTAERHGAVKRIAPIDLDVFAGSEDPAAPSYLAQQVAGRVAQAKAVGASFERAPQFLRPEERERLKDIADAGGDKALQLAGAIVRGAGADAPAVLKEIGGDAPVLAQAGVIIASGGSLGAARDAAEAARLKQVPGAKIANPDAPTFNRTMRDELGSAFLWQGEDRSRVSAAATAIAQTRLTRGAVDPKDSAAQEIYRRAVQEAAGAVFVDGVQFGGVGSYKPGWWSSYRVVLPPGVAAVGGLRDAINALRDDDLKALPTPPVSAAGKSYSARDLQGAIPVAVAGGYRFAANDPASDNPQYIRGADGQPFVLPWNTIEPMLRSRVPAAFLGGRR